MSLDRKSAMSVFSSVYLPGYFTSSYSVMFYLLVSSGAIVCTFKLLFVLFGVVADRKDALLALLVELESGESTMIVGVWDFL